MLGIIPQDVLVVGVERDILDTALEILKRIRFRTRYLTISLLLILMLPALYAENLYSFTNLPTEEESFLMNLVHRGQNTLVQINPINTQIVLHIREGLLFIKLSKIKRDSYLSMSGRLMDGNHFTAERSKKPQTLLCMGAFLKKAQIVYSHISATIQERKMFCST